MGLARANNLKALLFNPFIPMKTIVSSLQSLYGVILGITFTNAFKLFADHNYFDFNRSELLPLVWDIGWFCLFMLFTLMFVLMTWAEVFATIDDIETFIEYDSKANNDVERISYSRLILTAMVLISFSQAPIIIASAIINGYAKLISINSAIIMDIILFFAWISLSLFLYSLWKVVIIYTSIKKVEAKFHGYKQLTKLIGTGIISLITSLYYIAIGDKWVVMPKVNLVYPIFSIFAFFFLSWLIVIPWQRQQAVPLGSGYTSIFLILLLSVSPYVLFFAICTH